MTTTLRNRHATDLICILPAYADVLVQHADGTCSLHYDPRDVATVLAKRQAAAGEHGDHMFVDTLQRALDGDMGCLHMALQTMAQEKHETSACAVRAAVVKAAEERAKQARRYVGDPDDEHLVDLTHEAWEEDIKQIEGLDALGDDAIDEAYRAYRETYETTLNA